MLSIEELLSYLLVVFSFLSLSLFLFRFLRPPPPLYFSLSLSLFLQTFFGGVLPAFPNPLQGYDETAEDAVELLNKVRK